MTRKVGDARYQKTEQSILRTLSKTLTKRPSTISVKAQDLAKSSHISYSTLYRHYQSLDRILPAYEKRIFQTYRQLYGQQKVHSLRRDFYFLLIFIFNNRDFFKMQFTRHNANFVFRLLDISQKPNPDLAATPKRPNMVKIFYYQVYLILEEWSRHNFPERELDRALNYLIEASRGAEIKNIELN